MSRDMESTEMDDVGKPLTHDTSSTYRRPSTRKVFCRGLESCPTIVIMIVGILLAVLGLLAIITGPSCTCSKAVTNFKRVENSDQEYKCAQCSWLWLKCTAFANEYQCSRGCIIIAVDADGASTGNEPICLPQTNDLPKKYKYNTISPIQIIGVALCGVGLLVMLLTPIMAYRMGKHYLL